MQFSKKYLNLIYYNGINYLLKKHLTCKELCGIASRKCSHAHNILSTSSVMKNSRYGQPTPDTHKHLLKPGELIPGIPQDEFLVRRQNLVRRIISSKPNSCHVVLVPSATTQYMSEKIPYVFRQNSDFLYLTGCLEPDTALLLLIGPDESFESTLFMREKTDHSDQWEGPRTGVDNAVELFGVDSAKSINNLKIELDNICNSLKKFQFWYDFINPVNKTIHKCVEPFLIPDSTREVTTLRNKIHQLRLIKSKAEQSLMRESGRIGSRGMENAMRVTKPGLTEHQLFATIDYYSRMNGAEYLAYPPVVAAGPNANIIHYINNNQQIADGDLVLVDAGCELHGYCSDITRTWPANGCFTDAQRTLYEIILNTQQDLIQACSEPKMTLDTLFNSMCELLGQRLKEAHVLTRQTETMSLKEVSFKLCPHHVSHYLGMDVHDTATVNRKLHLQEGMVFTIEPGLYIKPGCELTRPEFHNTGLRIEDDILMTSSKVEVLSTACKDPFEVEKMVLNSD